MQSSHIRMLPVARMVLCSTCCSSACKKAQSIHVQNKRPNMTTLAYCHREALAAHSSRHNALYMYNSLFYDDIAAIQSQVHVDPGCQELIVMMRLHHLSGPSAVAVLHKGGAGLLLGILRQGRPLHAILGYECLILRAISPAIHLSGTHDRKWMGQRSRLSIPQVPAKRRSCGLVIRSSLHAGGLIRCQAGARTRREDGNVARLQSVLYAAGLIQMITQISGYCSNPSCSIDLRRHLLCSRALAETMIAMIRP